MAKINFLKKEEGWKEPKTLEEAEVMSEELGAKMDALLKLPNDKFLSAEVTKELAVLHDQILKLANWYVSQL